MSIARVYTQRFAARQGKTIACEKCRTPIAKGEQYRSFQVGFRSKFTHVRCMRSTCSPRLSELESSMLSEVYAGQEAAEDTLDDLLAQDPEDDASSVESAVHDFGDAIRNVADQYREADENFGGGGNTENGERADTLESAADEMENWSASENDPPDDEDCSEKARVAAAHDADPASDEEHDPDECDECIGNRRTWWEDLINEAREAISSVDLP